MYGDKHGRWRPWWAVELGQWWWHAAEGESGWEWRDKVPWTRVKLTVHSARAEAAHGPEFISEVGKLVVAVDGALGR